MGRCDGKTIQANISQTSSPRRDRVLLGNEGVHDVSVKDSIEKTGEKSIGVRRVDINKQDGENTKYRPKFVATGAKIFPMSEFHAATFPFEGFRIVMSHVEGGQPSFGKEKRLMTCDVPRVYVYAPSIRPAYPKFIEEDQEEGDEHTCERFNESMYGIIGAAFHWHLHYHKHL